MPTLENPKYERFALALFDALTNGKTRTERAQSTAYRAAFPTCSPGNPAEASASRLLRRVKPITDRVRELQAEHEARLNQKIDLSRERVGRRLDLASRLAEQQENPSGIATSELGIAKVFGHITDKVEHSIADYSQANSLADIGRMLLAQIGHDAPSDDDVALAIQAHDELVAKLEAIRDRSQELTLEHQASEG